MRAWAASSLLPRRPALRTPELRPRAAYDVESIVTYISFILGAPQAAGEWYESFRAALDLLCEQPDLGRAFNDERLRIQGRRTYLVGSYRVFYSYDASSLIVWRVLHTTQDMDDYALVDL